MARSREEVRQMYPDIHDGMRESECYGRAQFRVRDRVFKREEPGSYTDGTITVFCDQQDSTSWMARCGNLRTGYYCAPEFAVDRLIDDAAKVLKSLS